ncbi:MAG: response regulator [Myxococcales bacterium]|nr:response regulator [Myxococcales bacterium]MDD9970788.1 response regulator [Myxococcales bacterium]
MSTEAGWLIGESACTDSCYHGSVSDVKRPRRVLLADDSEIVGRQLAKIVGQSEEFELVGRASNGAEAIRMYAELEPDVVCMDIVMPILDGLKALGAILQSDSAAKVVVVTSLGTVADRVQEALALGAKAVVAKPFDAEQVLRALREV